jgi:hypothetical protein
MHKSRIGGVFIDHPAQSFDASLTFWSAATGRDVDPDAAADDPYRSLGLFGDKSPPRIHLDIDTDDVDAEVQRLEKLGATRLQCCDEGRYWQMVDPGGLVFCVIPPHTPDFDEKATIWP